LVSSTPAIANGVVYLGGTDGMRAFDATTGALLWQSVATAQFNGSPAVSDGVVYASTVAGVVYAFGLP
jgi:outer membrane protein assembly factor BamB